MDLQEYLNNKAKEYLNILYNEYGKYFNQEQLQFFQTLLNSDNIVVETNDEKYKSIYPNEKVPDAHGGRTFEDGKIHFYPFVYENQDKNIIKEKCESVLIHELFHYFIRPEYKQVDDNMSSKINSDITESLVDMCTRDIMNKYHIFPRYDSGEYPNMVVFIREALNNITNEEERMRLVFQGSVSQIFNQTSINGYDSYNEYINTKNKTTAFNQTIKEIASSNFPDHVNGAEREMFRIASNCKTKEEALVIIKGMLSDRLAENIIHNYYDDVSLSNEYVNNINYYYQNLLQSGIDVNSILNEYNPKNGMYPLKTKLSQNQVIELATDFFREINPEFANYFINDITNNKDNIFFSNDPKAIVKNDGSGHKLEVTNFGDLRDLYTIAHEYAHLFDSTNGLNEIRKVITETNAQCMERCLDSYLLSMTDDKLNNYQIDRKQLKKDITDRNIATFFNRFNNIKSINNQEFSIKDSSYFISQVYSTHFEKLDYDTQKVAINNMISETRNNNLPQVIANIPCDLSKNNPSRNEVVNQSVESTVQKITENKLQIQRTNDNVKRMVKTPSKLTNNQTANTSNKGYINIIILTLLTGIGMGIVSTLTYIFISK